MYIFVFFAVYSSEKSQAIIILIGFIFWFKIILEIFVEIKLMKVKNSF